MLQPCATPHGKAPGLGERRPAKEWQQRHLGSTSSWADRRPSESRGVVVPHSSKPSSRVPHDLNPTSGRAPESCCLRKQVDGLTGSGAVSQKGAPVGACLLEGDFGQATKANVLSSSRKRLSVRRRTRTLVCRFPGMMSILKVQFSLFYLGLLVLCYHQTSVSWIPTKHLPRKEIFPSVLCSWVPTSTPAPFGGARRHGSHAPLEAAAGHGACQAEPPETPLS